MPIKNSSWHLKKATEIIRSGGVIAYPTEAVYGLGCDPWDREAVLKILSIKKRSINKGLIVIASDLRQLESLICIPSQAIKTKISETWPGPSTWILPASDQCPYWLRGAHSGLAVRISAHPLCKALCELAGPIVSTSANIATKPALRTAWQVQMQFNDQLDYLLRGSSSGNIQPSTIRDALSDEVFR